MACCPKEDVGEEQEGENVPFSLIMNLKLTEPEVKLVELTLMSLVEGNTWCSLSPPSSFPGVCQSPTGKYIAQVFFWRRYSTAGDLTLSEECVRGQ